MSLLEVDRLSVTYGDARALDDVSLRVERGEIVALVGASGSGKSTLALAAFGLLPADARVTGTMRVEGCGAIVFQEPATALNPALTIGRQIGEVPALAKGRNRAERRAEVERLLARVGLDLSPDRYPHMLSGGQRQRVAIAMALAASPTLLIADESTAALDPLAGRQVVELLVGLARQEGVGLLLVTHDIALAGAVGDRVAVLADGRVVEDAPVATAFARPSSPQLAEQLTAFNAAQPPRRPAGGQLLLSAQGLTRAYADGVAALTDVGLTIARGETLGVVGASGSGKSTLARLLLGLDRPSAGRVAFDGRAFAVFQDPATSFDPRWTVEWIVAEPLYRLTLSPYERATRVAIALNRVGLDPAMAHRRPHLFSGGQRQRIALARALILEPDLVVLDEALTALDPTLRAEMVALLRRLQDDLGIAYLFVSHDLALVRQVAHRVLVLCEGRVVEEGATAEVLERPRDPYTVALVEAALGGPPITRSS